MAEWVRFPMWDRWRDLTRFRLACEMALDSYKGYVNGFPVKSTSPLTVYDPSGDSGFRCDLTEFSLVLNDGQALYRVLFPSYVALIEDLARDLIETLVRDKGLPRATFKAMPQSGDLSEAVERYVAITPVEVWGDLLLSSGSRSWDDFAGAKRGVVTAVTVRNLCAHGMPVFNQTAINRIAASTQAGTDLSVGDPVLLDKATFNGHVATLRAFGRVLADGVTNQSPRPS